MAVSSQTNTVVVFVAILLLSLQTTRNVVRYYYIVGCVLFSVFEISKTTVGHKCSLVRKAEKWF